MREVFDIAVIGGGVVGCATLRRFALEGLRAVLVEAGPDILCGREQGQQRHPPYRVRCAAGLAGASMHARRPCGISSDSPRSQPAAR